MLASILRVQPRRVLSATCRSSNVLIASHRSLSLVASRPTPSRLPVLSSTSFLRGYRGVPGDQEPKNDLFVANLPYDADENDLMREFSQFGKVKRTHLLRGGQHISGSRAAGFVEFEDVASAQRALEAGVEMSGRQLQLNYSKSNRDASDGRQRREPRMKYMEEPPHSDTLFIHRLPSQATETDLELIFSDFGTIKQILLPRKDDRVLGYAFIVFESEDSAMTARRSGEAEPFFLFSQDLVVRLNKSKSGNTRLQDIEAQKTPTPTLFIGKLAFSADKADVEQFFSKFGPVKAVLIAQKQDGTSRGFGFVTFENVESATKAYEACREKKEEFVICGHPVNLEYSAKKDFKAKEYTKDPSNTLWVGNIPYDSTVESMTEELSRFGPIQDVHIVKDRDGVPKGVAFVTYANLADAVAAHKAITESGLEMNRRKIRADYSARGNATSNTIEIRTPNRLLDKQWKELFAGFNILRKAAGSPRAGSEEYVFYASFDSVETAEKAMEKAAARKDDSMRLKYGRHAPVDELY